MAQKQHVMQAIKLLQCTSGVFHRFPAQVRRCYHQVRTGNALQSPKEPHNLLITPGVLIA